MNSQKNTNIQVTRVQLLHNPNQHKDLPSSVIMQHLLVPARLMIWVCSGPMSVFRKKCVLAVDI